MQRTVAMTGTRRLTAAFVNLRKARGKNGTSGRKLLESAREHPANLCRVTWHLHDWAPETACKYLFYREKCKKWLVRQFFFGMA